MLLRSLLARQLLPQNKHDHNMELLIQQLIAAIASLSLVLTNFSAQINQRGFVLGQRQVSNDIILGAASGSGNFPTSTLNNFQDGDTINAADWNALESKIGVNNSQVTSSLDWLLKAGTSTNPGHLHTTSSITGINYVKPVSEGGSGTSTYTYGVVIASSTNEFTTIAPSTAGNILTSNGSAWVSSSTSSGNVTVSTIAGEEILLGDAVYILDKTPTSTEVITTDSGTVDPNCHFPYSSTSTSAGQGVACAQAFQSSTTLNFARVALYTVKVGAPTGNIIVEIRPDNGGQASSTVLASTTIPDFSDTNYHYATFSTPVPVIASTTYWIVATSTTALSAANHFRWFSASLDFPNSNGKYISTSTWTNVSSTQDLVFKVENATRVRNVYKSSASALGTSNTFIGFAVGSASSSQNVNVTVSGIAIPRVNVLAGFHYYLDVIAGLITPSTSSLPVQRKVGIGVSTSTLIMTNIW